MEKNTNKPERKFKVGEIVLVKAASKHFGWQSEMQERIGKQGVISKFYCGDEKIKGEYGYRIGDYVWPESALEKQFSPKPGDKIICNNGEEFVCCTLETLKDKFLSPAHIADTDFFGYSKRLKNGWMNWTVETLNGSGDWCAKEVIPDQQEVKQQVTEDTPAQGDNTVGAVFQERTYTLQQIKEAFYILQWREDALETFISKLNEPQDSEYKLYLELKAKFEGKE